MRTLLESLYFLSGIALAVMAGIALKQLKLMVEQIKLMKSDMRYHADRAAKEKASEAHLALIGALRDFAATPMETVDEVSLPRYYRGPTPEDFSFDSLSDESKESARRRWSSSHLAAFISHIEVVAAMFIGQIADEESGCRLFGAAFCALVLSQYDVISFDRSVNPTAGLFSSTRELYNIWRPRLDKPMLERKRLEIERQLEAANKTPIQPIAPSMPSRWNEA